MIGMKLKTKIRKLNTKKWKLPGGGTAVTALHTAQHTEVAPAG